MTEELQKKIDRAIKLIQSASKIAAKNGCTEIEVCYSGGKDSDVILELTKMAGVPYRAIYKNTTIDPIGTIKHAKEMGAEVLRPKRTFFEIIEKHGFPTRFRRFCCRYLKEYKVLDYAIVGIRRDESVKRAKIYKEPEMCRVYSKKEKCRLYLPILDWTSKDVEEFILERGIKCAPVYYDEQGNFHVERRLGCLCCPLTGMRKRLDHFKEHPNMIKAYARHGEKYRRSHPNSSWVKNHTDVYAQIVHDLFYCNNQQGWRDLNSGFLPPPIYKDFLEDYFKIKFKE